MKPPLHKFYTHLTIDKDRLLRELGPQLEKYKYESQIPETLANAILDQIEYMTPQSRFRRVRRMAEEAFKEASVFIISLQKDFHQVLPKRIPVAVVPLRYYLHQIRIELGPLDDETRKYVEMKKRQFERNEDTVFIRYVYMRDDVNAVFRNMVRGVSSQNCHYCGGPGTAVCGRCAQVRYCSTKCQELDWPRHRGECRPIREKRIVE